MKSNTEIALRIAGKFVTDGTPVAAEECCTGHINQTFFITCEGGACSPHRYVLQEINTSIFKNPDEVMENIYRVTGHIRRKLAENGGDAERGTLCIVDTEPSACRMWSQPRCSERSGMPSDIFSGSFPILTPCFCTRVFRIFMIRYPGSGIL